MMSIDIPGSARASRAGDGASPFANFSPHITPEVCGKAPQTAREARALRGVPRRER
jgi:hypothetical protein